MSAIVTELIGILVSGLTAMATGIGTGLQSYVTALFVDTTAEGGYKLTTFGGLIAVFGGIALAISLGRLVLMWVMSLGAKHN